MSTIAVRESPRANASRKRGNALDGTGTLLRLILRRERIRTPAWLLGFVVMLLVSLSGVEELTSTEEKRQDVFRFMDGASGAIFGPGYGRYDITAERYVVGVYGLFFFVLVALMSVFLVARHTRAEEQNGHAEMLRSRVVGRHAHLTAGLLFAVGTNVALALALAATMVAYGLDGGNGLLFGASVGAVGLVFSGITALVVQLTGFSRTATGMAGAVLGVSWAVRAAGDMIRDFGSPMSWFSPLAWSNQTRPFVDGRWWPLLLSVGLAAAAAAAGYVLSGRRDIGAGLIATRPGAPSAAPWLKSPPAAAFRLQRGSILWWTVGLGAFGFVFGAMGEQVADPEAMSSSRLEMFGGSLDTVMDGYVAMITIFTVVLSGIMGFLGVQAMRHEETEGRAEPVLATATSRWAWFGSYLSVMALSLLGLLLVAGIATGTGAAVAAGESSYILDSTMAHLAYAPSVLAVLGLAALLFGVLPRAIGATWALIGFSMFVGVFGTTMDLPGWLSAASPYEHIGRPPLDSVSWPGTLILLLVSAGLMAAGLAGFSRRDLESK